MISTERKTNFDLFMVNLWQHWNKIEIKVGPFYSTLNLFPYLPSEAKAIHLKLRNLGILVE